MLATVYIQKGFIVDRCELHYHGVGHVDLVTFTCVCICAGIAVPVTTTVMTRPYKLY